MDILFSLFLIIIGLSGGLAVGSGFVAFVTVLDIIPRLTQIFKGYKYIKLFQLALIIGAVFFTLIDLLEIVFNFSIYLNLFIGVLSGIFVGLLAAALTEVLNVLPILAKRLKMTNAIIILLMAMIFGKVFGSLFHWLIFIQR